MLFYGKEELFDFLTIEWFHTEQPCSVHTQEIIGKVRELLTLRRLTIRVLTNEHNVFNERNQMIL